MITVTVPQLIEKLETTNGRGAKIATVVTLTEPDMVKKHRVTKLPNPYLNGKLTRLAERTIVLGANYEALVNRERIAEGNLDYFNAEQLWHGAGAKHRTYTVVHKPTGRIYFAYKPQVAEPEHAPKVLRDEWRFDGRKLTAEEVADLKENLLVAKGPAKKQDVEREIFWQTLNLENLVELRYGEVYGIDHSIPANVEFVPAA